MLSLLILLSVTSRHLTSAGVQLTIMSKMLGNAAPYLPVSVVIVQAPALTLLMPLDSLGVCGHGSRSLPVPPHGCTRQHLLHSIYNFYQVSSESSLPCVHLGIKCIWGSCAPIIGVSVRLHHLCEVEIMTAVLLDLQPVNTPASLRQDLAKVICAAMQCG